jgi:hypothetical protein
VKEETQAVRVAARRTSDFILASLLAPSWSAFSPAVNHRAGRCASVASTPRVCSPIKGIAGTHECIHLHLLLLHRSTYCPVIMGFCQFTLQPAVSFGNPPRGFSSASGLNGH